MIAKGKQQKDYIKRMAAELFRDAISKFLEDIKSDYKKMEELGLTKNSPERQSDRR